MRPGGQDDWLRNRAWMHAHRGIQFEDVLAQLRVDVQRCPAEKGREPWTEADLQRHARSACAKAASEPDVKVTFEPDQLRAAVHFAETRGHDWRYDHRQGRWLRWDGVRWAPDLDEGIVRATGDMVLAQLAASVGGRGAGKTASLTSRAALCGIRDIARTLPPIASRGDEWDTDPMLLGVPNGVVDLRTGQLRAATQADRVTMQASFPYDPDARCPLWKRTLAEVFAKDPEIVPYLQRALGYSLTGDTRHEVFFMATSALDAAEPGREGKGTVINTVARVLGDYAADLGFASLEDRKEESGASPDLAKLMHRRFVTASETRGRRFNEARIKRMTGRDPITCRFLYGQEFTYLPEFKLWLSVNHLPKVRDDAFWSRPHRIPFRTSFRGHEDTTLKDRLIDEGPGILAWLVAGALEWRGAGHALQAPESVTAATREYRESQSPLAEFLDARCVIRASCFVAKDALREAYVRWCDAERVHFRLGPKRFGQEVLKRFPEAREPSGERRWGYQGIGLAVADREPGEDDAAPF